MYTLYFWFYTTIHLNTKQQFPEKYNHLWSHFMKYSQMDGLDNYFELLSKICTYFFTIHESLWNKLEYFLVYHVLKNQSHKIIHYRNVTNKRDFLMLHDSDTCYQFFFLRSNLPLQNTSEGFAWYVLCAEIHNLYLRLINVTNKSREKTFAPWNMKQWYYIGLNTI